DSGNEDCGKSFNNLNGTQVASESEAVIHQTESEIRINESNIEFYEQNLNVANQDDIENANGQESNKQDSRSKVIYPIRYASQKGAKLEFGMDKMMAFTGILLVSGCNVNSRRRIYWEESDDVKDVLISCLILDIIRVGIDTDDKTLDVSSQNAWLLYRKVREQVSDVPDMDLLQFRCCVGKSLLAGHGTSPNRPEPTQRKRKHWMPDMATSAVSSLLNGKEIVFLLNL
ncbi:hypothetical protein ILUMI_14086, partial [Ignelater luminosus]